MKNIVCLSLLLLICNCSENEMAKDYGGTVKIDLPPNQKLENISWKDADLWYVFRPMRKDEFPELHIYRQKGVYNIHSGVVEIQEHKGNK